MLLVTVVVMSLGFTNQAGLEVDKLLTLMEYHNDKDAAFKKVEDRYAVPQRILFNSLMFKNKQRPQEIFKNVPFDFHGKSVLDIGCKQGSMLFALRHKIRWGVGLDYNASRINFANRTRRYFKSNSLDFYQMSLTAEPLQIIPSFFPGNKKTVDICLLLSMCSYLENWQAVVDYATSISRYLLFQTSGTQKQRENQERYLKFKYTWVQQTNKDSLPSTKKIFLCRR